jgi:hypothetical protein
MSVMTYAVLIGIVIALFLLAFVTRRRFGILGLGLSAGALLASSFSRQLAAFFETNSIGIEGVSADILARCVLILLPSLLLLLGGPKYTKTIPRIAGSAGYAVMGTLLLFAPLSALIEINGSATRSALQFVAEYQSGLIALGVAAAVVDTIMMHSPKLRKSHDKH